MDFYKAQDQARRQTHWLVFLYTLSVLSMVLITNICLAVFVWYSNPSNFSGSSMQADFSLSGLFSWLYHIFAGLGWYKVFWVSTLVCGVIGFAMLFKWLSLRDGGRVVAESLGGRVLATNTQHVLERRLLNVVEEIALASGVPVPPVYLMENEQGINAFAAGLSLEDAVIGVTSGTLVRLNREQLQGVIAHEFSHILNGDMLLNMKLLAVLHGILMVGEAGRTMTHYGSRRSFHRTQKNSNGAFFVLGLCLCTIGWLGQFFGAMIKSAVSRQREFLADASAVQFTRNPEGIGGALKLIGGYDSHSTVKHQGAHELGHLFFSSAYKSFLSLFATHPPLEERILRVLPSWNGKYQHLDQGSISRSEVPGSERIVRSSFVGDNEYATQGPRSDQRGADLVDNQSTPDKSSDIHGEAIEFSLENDGDSLSYTESISDQLTSLVHDPLGALTLVFALLLDDQDDVLGEQLEALKHCNEGWSADAIKIKALLTEYKLQYAGKLERAGSAEAYNELQWLKLSMPALKLLSLKQYQSLREAMAQMVNADGRVVLFEWVVYQLVRQHCDRHFGLSKALKPKYKTLNRLAPFYEVVLSRVVHYGGGSDAEKALAFNKACRAAGIDTIKLLPPDLCSQGSFTRSVHALGRAYPLIKPRLIKGLISAVQSDLVICEHERQVVTGIAAVMDCPLIGLEL